MTNLIKFPFPLTLVLCLFTSLSLGAADWSNWRGPSYNGSAGGNLKYPAKFSPNEGVRWTYDLPGASASTPIIHGDFVYISTVSSSAENPGLAAICLNRADGSLVWNKNVGSGYRPGNGDGLIHQLDSKSNYASPSPVAHGDGVVFFYGNGDLVSLSISGDILWRRNLQKDFGDFCFQWTFSASPTLHQGKLYLPVLQRNEPVHGRGKPGALSNIYCFDLKDGEVIWVHQRNTLAVMESRESFTTLIPHQGNLLLAGGDFLSSHNPDTGAEQWRWGTWNVGHRQAWWRLVPSPVIGAGKALVCAPKGAPVYAVSINQGKGGASETAQLAWDSSGAGFVTSDVPTPLFFNDKFYVLSDVKKNLSCLNPEDGKVIWKVSLPGKYKWRSSPTGGDGKIFIMNHNAEVLVIDAVSGSVLHDVKMGGTYDDLTRASIALSHGFLFIRTNEKLYCIE